MHLEKTPRVFFHYLISMIQETRSNGVNTANSRKWYPVVETNVIPVKEGRRVTFGNQEVALFNIGGEYLAIDNHCPHKQGPLSEGIVAGKAVFCPLHNMKINLENGCALTGGQGQVKTYPVKMLQGKVCIAFHEGRFHVLENQAPSAADSENMMDVN